MTNKLKNNIGCGMWIVLFVSFICFIGWAFVDSYGLRVLIIPLIIIFIGSWGMIANNLLNSNDEKRYGDSWGDSE